MTVGDKPQIYADLMRFRPDGMTPNAWAMKAGVSRTVWADMRRHGNPSRRTLEKLLTAAGSSLAEFEALRISGPSADEGPSAGIVGDRRASPWRAPQGPSLPLIATTMAGEWGEPHSRIELTELRTDEIVDRISRPLSLANDEGAYAITMVGDSMWPRFRPGRRLAVSPMAPVAIGDDVVVKLNESRDRPGSAVRALIKELVRKGGSTVELRQFNPDLTFEVPAAAIASIEKVLGELL
jgi:SOS-response transcriptional repressor LexA